MNTELWGSIALIILGAWLITWLVDWITPRLARVLARFSDKASSPEQVIQLRRLETFLGIGAAVVRVLVVLAAMYLIWRILMPTTAPVALIGASAFVAIIAGSTLGPLLRDLTTGTLMIAERWYHVGDHITVEPFVGVSGVVEALTPRSTKLRSLSGEVIWLHNQHIQGVRVMNRGVRTIALDLFVTDLDAGKHVVEQAFRMLPTGPMKVARQEAVTDTEELGGDLWRITATAQTIPGREWLIEDFAVKAILKYDALKGGDSVIVHGPIARYVSDTAERRFKRAVRPNL